MARLNPSRIVLALLFVLAAAAAAPGADVVSQGLRTAVRSAAPAETIPVILSFSTARQVEATVMTQAVYGREHLVRTLMTDGRARRAQVIEFLRAQGVEEVRELWLIDSLAFAATPDLIESLADWPEVASVRRDQNVYLPPAPAPESGAYPAAFSDPQENILTVNAPALWDIGYDGSGIVVAVMDSGVDVLHPDLAARWRGGSNSWFDPFGDTVLPFDFLDSEGVAHGTGVAGILVGGDAGGTTIGVAPGAQWIAAKIFGDADLDPGTSTFSRIHQAFQWLLDPDGDPATADAPDILNGSWGMGGGILPPLNECVTEFQADIQALRESGIGVIFSAGNTGALVDGPSSLSPGNYPESFSVGSVDDDLVISDFSARGPSACDESIFPDLVAPGEPIRSAARTQNGAQPLSYNTRLTGTSFATPHVSGVLTLLKGAFPDLSISALEDAMRDSAFELGDPGPDNAYGYGLIDAQAAYRLLADQTGRPAELLVRDSVFPEDDEALEFAALPAEETSATITVYNAGGGTLDITSVIIDGEDAGLFAPTTDTCSEATLLGTEGCTIRLTFTPPFEGFAAELVIQTSAGSLTLPINGSTDSPSPQARLSATDVDFGHVPPDQQLARIVQVENVGTGVLDISEVDTSELPPGMSLVADPGGPLGCADKSLAPGERCDLYLLFAPTDPGDVAGSLAVTSNDPQSPLVIDVSAVGNTPPPRAELLSPVQNASVAGDSVTFRWNQPPDADGDDVASLVLFDTSGEFPDPDTAEPDPISAALLGGSGFALFFLVARRRRILPVLGALAAGAILLAACNGSGGGGDGEILPDPVIPEVERRATVTGLQSGTTYYWKVQTTDVRGAVVESPVRQFTTR